MELADKDGNIQQALVVTYERIWQRYLKSPSLRNAFSLSGIYCLAVKLSAMHEA